MAPPEARPRLLGLTASPVQVSRGGGDTLQTTLKSQQRSDKNLRLITKNRGKLLQGPGQGFWDGRNRPMRHREVSALLSLSFLASWSDDHTLPASPLLQRAMRASLVTAPDRRSLEHLAPRAAESVLLYRRPYMRAVPREVCERLAEAASELEQVRSG